MPEAYYEGIRRVNEEFRIFLSQCAAWAARKDAVKMADNKRGSFFMRAPLVLVA